MLLFGKIYIHRVTLALIAIIHVKGDAAWQGEGISCQARFLPRWSAVLRGSSYIEEDEHSPPLRQVLWRTYQIGSCRKSVIKPRQHQRSQITLQVKRGENIP